MTSTEVQVLRDKYFAEMVAMDAMKTSHSVDGESQQHDEHRKSISDLFTYYDNLLIKKQSAGKTYRLNKKVL